MRAPAVPMEVTTTPYSPPPALLVVRLRRRRGQARGAPPSCRHARVYPFGDEREQRLGRLVLQQVRHEIRLVVPPEGETLDTQHRVEFRIERFPNPHATSSAEPAFEAVRAPSARKPKFPSLRLSRSQPKGAAGLGLR